MQNDLIIEPHRLEFFYKRLVKKGNFDLTHLAKLVTSCRRESIIDSTTVKVDGMSSEHRRTKPLIEQNPKLAPSLTPHNSKKRSKSATKAYQTSFINNELLVQALRRFLRDQMKIDDEIEDARI